MSQIKFILETIISTLLYYSGFNWLYEKIMRNGRNIPIIFYHEIGSNDKDGSAKFSVSVEHFEKQIKWLTKRFNIVTIDELIKHITGEIKLPGKVIAVTFDGGYVGNYQHAFPLLKKYNIPATIYIITDPVGGNLSNSLKLLYLTLLTQKDQFKLTYNGKEHEFEIRTRDQKRLAKEIILKHMRLIDSKKQDNLLKQISQSLNVELSGLAQKLFLSWDQIYEMNNNPLITIESHSLTHPRLTEVALEEARREIVESKVNIESKLGEKITSFCYPDGFFNEEIIDLVKEAGYSSALAVITSGILNDLNKIGDNVFELRRIHLPDRFYKPLISTEISGIMRTLKKFGKYFGLRLIKR